MSLDKDRLIKDLVTAVSTQAQVANRAWLTLMTVVAFVVVQTAGQGQAGQPIAELHFLGLNANSLEALSPILLGILVVLSVAFSSAHAQQVRAQKITRPLIRSLPVVKGEPHPQELFDMLCQPSVIRVAPLAQSLRGAHQFFETTRECPRWLRILSAVYYLLLKMGAIGIYFLLPLWALWLVSLRVWHVETALKALLVLVPIAGVALLQVTITEGIDAFATFKRIAKD